MKRGWRGIYSLHTKYNRYTHNWAISVRPKLTTRSDRKFKYSERWGFRWDRKYHLGYSDLMTNGYRSLAAHVSVRPISNSECPIFVGFGLWLRWFISVWLSLENWLVRDYLWVCIVVKVADSWRRYITKHLSNQIINTTSSPFNSIGFSYGLNVILDH